jgi:hypothetical protein
LFPSPHRRREERKSLCVFLVKELFFNKILLLSLDFFIAPASLPVKDFFRQEYICTAAAL